MLKKVCVSMISKTMYREGLIDIPTTCQLNTTSYYDSQCSYQCRDSDSTQMAVESLYINIHQYLDLTNPKYNTTDKVYDVLREFICGSNSGMSRIYYGDHYEASSITDPTFWVFILH